MKKIVLGLVFGLMASVSFAAQFTWTATGLDAAFVNGTSYLVHASTVDIGKISNALSTTGIASTTPTGYTEVGSVATTTTSGLTYAMGNLTTDVVTTPTVGQYFIVVISQDLKNYALGKALDPNSGDSVTFSFTIGQADWVANGAKVGPVPEPTVLALLALGVAGLALKRKNA